jgi:hypothetical protein
MGDGWIKRKLSRVSCWCGGDAFLYEVAEKPQWMIKCVKCSQTSYARYRKVVFRRWFRNSDCSIVYVIEERILK